MGHYGTYTYTCTCTYTCSVAGHDIHVCKNCIYMYGWHMRQEMKDYRATCTCVRVYIRVQGAIQVKVTMNTECTYTCTYMYSFSLSLQYTCTYTGNVHYRMHYFWQWPQPFCMGFCHLRNIKASATVTCRRLDMECSICTGELNISFTGGGQ